MCNCELVLVKFSLCWDGRILHFICDGAKEFLFVKRMPKRFESEFNMLASMFHDHLLLDFFFPVQRLHGFRQVVTHVQSQQNDEL